ncbi:MAG TPA: glycerol-3-phosphate dehydrogenase/oxidase [bacterium]|nr:glycerol-3-phosphate dehydrogenase/oxidase [bacterium]
MKRDTRLLTKKNYELIVVGGGIYGAAVAWDAALRGLSVALVEQGDFGSGTTFNSLKIVHGGLRYLQTLDLKRFRESVRERMILMRIAPHLVHPMPCVMPTYGHMMKGPEVLLAGLTLNDILSADRNRLKDPEKKIPGTRLLSAKQTREMLPGIDSAGINGGAFWTDAQMTSSERMVIAFILSAVAKGAQAVNYMKAREILVQGRKAVGIRAEDRLTGRKLEIRGDAIVNAAGGWAGDWHGDSATHCLPLLSTAMNLVVRGHLLHESAAGIYGRYEYPVPDGYHQGRHLLFMAPWRQYTLIGTYHRPYEESDVHLRVTENEILSFLNEINSSRTEPVRRDSVTFFYKGFLPMDGINPKTGEVQLTKHYRIIEHERENGLKNLITVAGVKYTTARDVAAKTVDLVFCKRGNKVPPCRTHCTPLMGGHIYRFDDFLNRTRKTAPGLPESVIDHLAVHYGSDTSALYRYLDDDESLRESLPGSREVIGAQIVHAVREEMAVHLADVVLRRTALGSGECPSEEALEICARLMGLELRWNAAKRQKEIRAVQSIYKPFKPIKE